MKGEDGNGAGVPDGGLGHHVWLSVWLQIDGCSHTGHTLTLSGGRDMREEGMWIQREGGILLVM